MGWQICKGLPLLTRSSSPKKCENLNLRAPCAPNHTKVPFCVDFTGRIAGWTRPLGARPGFSPAPKGVLPPCIRPKKTTITGKKPSIWGAWGGRFSLFVCFMPQQRRGGRIRPGNRRTCRGKAPPSCCARPFGRLKAPLGLSLLRCACKRELSLDVLGEGQAILPCIFQQELVELLLRNRRFQTILSENC